MAKKQIVVNQVANIGRIRRKHSLMLDVLMMFLTGGLWLIWMIIRPKYY